MNEYHVAHRNFLFDHSEHRAPSTEHRQYGRRVFQRLKRFDSRYDITRRTGGPIKYVGATLATTRAENPAKREKQKTPKRSLCTKLTPNAAPSPSNQISFRPYFGAEFPRNQGETRKRKNGRLGKRISSKSFHRRVARCFCTSSCCRESQLRNWPSGGVNVIRNCAKGVGALFCVLYDTSGQKAHMTAIAAVVIPGYCTRLPGAR